MGGGGGILGVVVSTLSWAHPGENLGKLRFCMPCWVGKPCLQYGLHHHVCTHAALRTVGALLLLRRSRCVSLHMNSMVQQV